MSTKGKPVRRQRRLGSGRKAKARKGEQRAGQASSGILSCGKLTFSTAEPAPCEALVLPVLPVWGLKGALANWSVAEEQCPAFHWQGGTIGSLPREE